MDKPLTSSVCTSNERIISQHKSGLRRPLDIEQFPECGMHLPVAPLPLLPRSKGGMDKGGGLCLREARRFSCGADLCGGRWGHVKNTAFQNLNDFE